MPLVVVAKLNSGRRTSKSVPREVWIGLSTPTIGGWVASVCFAVSEFCFLCVFLSPKSLARIDARYLMESSRDDYARVSLALARLHASLSTVPGVVYVGSSQAKWALTSWNDAELGRELSRRGGFRVDFHDCTSDRQHYEDTLFIVDQLPPTFRGVVLVAVDDHRDAHAASRGLRTERWIGDVAPDYDASQVARGIEHEQSGVFFLDHLDFFAARRIAAVRVGFPIENPYPSQLGFRDGDREKEMRRTIQRRLANEWSGAPPALTKAAPMLVSVAERLEARGIGLVFFEPPRNPMRLDADAERVADYDAEIPLFAEGLGVDYWQFDDLLDLDAEDFSDPHHLKSDAARRKFQGLIFDKVAGWLEDSGLGQVERAAREDSP